MLCTSQDPGPELFQSLTHCHGESLTELILEFDFASKSINTALLKGCTNLVSLSLGRAKSYQGSFGETFTWLKELKKLRILALLHSCEPAWIAPILLGKSIHLTSLKYQSLQKRDTKIICQALANQTGLQRLWLEGRRGEDEDTLKETEALVDSLAKLVNLTDLRLERLSDSFADRHIVQLANSLPKLVSWSTWGNRLTDAIWGEIASLRSLQRLELWGWMSFTANSILDFIGQLGPGNEGLVLFLIYDGEYDDNGDRVGSGYDEPFLPWKEIYLIRKTIAKKLDGKFKLVSTA